MLSSNDYQVIRQIIRNELERMKDPEGLQTKLKEAQHEANFLSAELCKNKKGLQRIGDILETSEWLDEGEELVTITRTDYTKMLDILDGGIV